MTEAEIKERPAKLVRRAPRPAPDEKVDPVDYSPSATAVVPVPDAGPVGSPSRSGGAEPAVSPSSSHSVQETVSEPTAVQEPIVETQAPVAATQEAPAAPVKQAPRASKASKVAANKKASRREVTFPLSTRVSQEVLDILYTATEEEGISVREAIEQGIKSRWG